VRSVFESGDGQRDPSAAPPDVTLAPITEVGYAAELARRGCTTSVTVDRQVIPFVFHIGYEADDSGDLLVNGDNQRMFAARFGNLDQDGQFKHSAAPIGRAAITRLVRDGVEQMHVHDPAYAMLSRGQDSAVASAMGPVPDEVVPERIEAVGDVELTGSCRKNGAVYTCPLLVEYDSPLLSPALGGVIVETEIGFVQHGSDGAWALAAGFEEAFEKGAELARERSIASALTAQ
jgi:hypothetical protein